MDELKFKTPYKLSEIITAISEDIKANNFKLLNFEKMNFCIYTLKYIDKANEDTVCYLD